MTQPLPDPKTLDYQEIIRHLDPTPEGVYLNDDLFHILFKILDVNKINYSVYIVEVERILRDLGYTWKTGLGHKWKGHKITIQEEGSWVIKESFPEMG